MHWVPSKTVCSRTTAAPSWGIHSHFSWYQRYWGWDSFEWGEKKKKACLEYDLLGISPLNIPSG